MSYSYYSSSSSSSSQMSPTTTRRGAGRQSSHCPKRDITDDILSLVDQHLAWQAESSACELARRGSVGTLIVDWDGVGEGRAFHRGSRESDSAGSESSAGSGTEESRNQVGYGKDRGRPSEYSAGSEYSTASMNTSHHHDHQRACRPGGSGRRDSMEATFHRGLTRPAPVPNGDAGISVAYSPHSNIARGYDPRSNMGYAYNGRTFRVAHPPSSSNPSRPNRVEDFHIPVEKYSIGAQNLCPPSSSPSSHPRNRVGRDKALPTLPIEERKKRKVLDFVHKVLHKLDRIGVLGRMRQEMESRRRSNRVT